MEYTPASPRNWISSTPEIKWITIEDSRQFVQDFVPIQTSPETAQIGRFGENFIFDKLSAGEIHGYWNIVWVNKSMELGKPFDFEATFQGELVWIEAKTQSESSNVISNLIFRAA